MTLSICVTVKNRSRVQVGEKELLLFPNCVRSLVDSVGEAIQCELVVADWGSDDWPLSEWLAELASPIPVKIILVEGSFSRGKGLNIAANAASGDFLLFADTDLLFGPEVINAGIKYLSENKAYFPILFYYNDTSHTEGWWNYYSYGNCFVTRKMFNDANQWPEYKTWGKEDDHFYESIGNLVEVERNQTGGFCHQWHPDDLIWKNRYAEKADEIAEEIRQVEESVKVLQSVIPEGETFIIIDEARFGGSDCVPGRREIQFPEKDGEYAGAPATSEDAIVELKKQLERNPSYLVIAWMAFWWLEYYREFSDYIHSHFHSVFESDSLKIFEIPLNHSVDLINEHSIQAARNAAEFQEDITFIKSVRSQNLTYLEEQALVEIAEVVRSIEFESKPGIFLEAGCALGGSSIVITKVKRPGRPFFIYDVFGMIPPPSDKDGADIHQRYRTIAEGASTGIGSDKYYGYEENLVKKVYGNFSKNHLRPEDNSVVFIRGLYEDMLVITEPVSFAHIDCDWYDSVTTCLSRITPFLVPGGVVVIDDYNAWSGCRQAVDEFFADKMESYRFIHRSRLHIIKR